MTNQEEAIKTAAKDSLEEKINITLKDSLVEFYYSREEYISAKIMTSEKHKITYALHEEKYLALKESIKGNAEANDLLFKLMDLTEELGVIDIEMYYKQGLNDGLNLINSIREL